MTLALRKIKFFTNKIY